MKFNRESTWVVMRAANDACLSITYSNGRGNEFQIVERRLSRGCATRQLCDESAKAALSGSTHY
jgi:hypothetical protein